MAEHLTDPECWLVACFRHSPRADLRLRDGQTPDPQPSAEQLKAWSDHAAGCRECETRIQCDLHVVRRTALRASKPPPVAATEPWWNMVE